MKRLQRIFLIPLALGLLVGAMDAQAQTKAQLRRPDERPARTQMALAEEVRHQLLTLPYYGIFDWLDAVVTPDGQVVLSGQVVRPSTKADAEARVKQLEGVTAVVDHIEELPVSTFDNQTRIAVYRRLASQTGLTKYFFQAVPPIHIIVKNGRVALKGVVDSAMDSQLAYTAASGTPDVFEVKNELRIQTPES